MCIRDSLNARYGYDVRCEIVGETGTLALTEPLRMVRDSARQRATGYPADWRPRFADAYRLELQAWIDGVTGGQPSAAWPPLTTGWWPARWPRQSSARCATVAARWRW